MGDKLKITVYFLDGTSEQILGVDRYTVIDNVLDVEETNDIGLEKISRFMLDAVKYYVIVKEY